MTPEERDEYLSTQRTCRVATVRSDGTPHVSPLWFVWDGDHLWLNSIVASQRWRDVDAHPSVSIVVDDGDDFGELRGVELSGRAEPVGEAPRTGEPHVELEIPEQLFGEKYGGGQFRYDGRHAWLRVTPAKIVSWDFRKAVPA